MNRTLSVYAFMLLLCVCPLHAQTSPILTSVRSDQPATGTAKLSGLAINPGLGPTLTFFGSNFSNQMSARFTTRNLRGVQGRLDVPLTQTFFAGDQDSGKVELDITGLKNQQLFITSGPVYLYDHTTGLPSADSVNIVVVPSVFAFKTPPHDFLENLPVSFTPGETLLVEGSGIIKNATTLILPKAGGETIHVTPTAIGSIIFVGSDFEPKFQADTLGEGLFAQFVVPNNIGDRGGVRIETPSGISAAYVYRKPHLQAAARVGPPLRGSPADPSKLAVNVRDTLQLTVANLEGAVFPGDGNAFWVRGVYGMPLSSFFVSLSPDSTQATAIVPPAMVSGSPRVANRYVDLLQRYSYFLMSEAGPFVQVVPTLDSLKGNPLIGPGNYITLFGSGFQQHDGQYATVKFSRQGGGTTEAIGSFLDGSGTQLSVLIPNDAAPGPLYAETEGGRSDTLQLAFVLRPLQVNATAASGLPADPSLPSANTRQTIIVKSVGILPTTLLVTPGAGALFVTNISADSTTAEVQLTNDWLKTGRVWLADYTGGWVSESQILQIVPTVSWLSSPGFAPGNEASVHGTGFDQDSTRVVFADATGGESAAEFLRYSYSPPSLTVKLPAQVVAGVMRVSTSGGADSLLVNPPILDRLIVTAQNGIPADAALPSANIGQVMKVEGNNLGNDVEVRFFGVDLLGTPFDLDFDLLNVSGGIQGEVVVGSATVPGGLQIGTGDVKLLKRSGSLPPLVSGQAIKLQIVPTLTAFDVPNFAPGQVATLTGSGFVQNQTNVLFTDSLGNQIQGMNVQVISSSIKLNVTLPPGATPGPITVRTNGGTSLPLNVAPPQIASISPTQAIRGTAVQMTLNGTNFSIGSKVKFSGAGITVDTTAYFSPLKLIAAFRIDTSAPLGAREVIVTNPTGDADTLFAAFTVLRDPQPPTISGVTPLPNTGNTVGPYPVLANVTDNIDVKNVYLVFSANNFATRDSLVMSLAANQKYSATIPGQSLNTTVKYFVSAFDFDGNRSSDPANAPTANYSFQVLAIPVFVPISDQAVDEGENLTFTVHATDVNSDSITYSATNLPSGATFTGPTFSWRPSYTQSGNYLVTFTATDNHDGAASTMAKIVVNEIDNPPLVQGPSSRTVYVGQLLEIPFSITDPDGNALMITYMDQPAGSTVYDSGTATKFFRWKPQAAHVGTHKPKFIANDGLVADTLLISILVSNPPGPVVDSVTPAYGHVGEVVTLKGIAFGGGTGTMLFNGTAAAAAISGDTIATAMVPNGASTGPLLLISPGNKVSNPKFFTVLATPTVNLVAQSLESSAPMVLVGNSLTLKAKIHNLGAFAAQANITFFSDHPDSGGVALGAPQSFNIAANGQVEQSFVWTPQTPGFFHPHGRITGSIPQDTKLFDNTIEDGIVSVIAGSSFELVNIYAPPDEFVIGKPKNYSISLLNSGFQAAQVTAITVDGSFGFVPSTALPLSLPPGQLKTFVFTVTLPPGTSAGHYTIDMQVMTAAGNTYDSFISFKATEENPTVTARLIDALTGSSVAGVRVFANEVEQTPTDANGEVTFQIPSGTTMHAVFFKEGYLPAQTDLSTSAGASRRVNVFIQPGEIIVSNVEVKPLTSEEIAQLGLDLNDPANFNYYRFSATIQTSPDEPPDEVNWVVSAPADSNGVPAFLYPCSNVTKRIVEGGTTVDAANCRVIHWLRTETDTCASWSTPMVQGKLIELTLDPCDSSDTYTEQIPINIGGIMCKQTIWYVCPQSSEETEDDSGGNSASGGAMTPQPEVTIPYVLEIGGAVRTLKEFFNVTLAIGNQAAPSFTVSDLQVELTSAASSGEGGASPITIVKDAEPLPNLAGGQYASTTWILRGDEVGAHAIQVSIKGKLQPGNIILSATQFATVIVNEPPQLNVRLSHPAQVANGQSFTLSATVTNNSATTVARQASIEVFLNGSAELQSPARQELDDIPPGATRTASWAVLARGDGEITGCDQSSGSNLGFTLLIGNQPCDHALPSDTGTEPNVPAGKVVILGTDIPIPNVEVSTVGTGSNGSTVVVSAITDRNGAYHFPKRVFGNDLHFSLRPQDFDQQVVRGLSLDVVKSVTQDAAAMPTLELGATNEFAKMNQIIASLKDTASVENFFAAMASVYNDEEALVQALLDSSAQVGLWGADLDRTREAYFRLFLAQRLLAQTRVHAESMALTGSRAIGAALVSTIELLVDQLKLEDKLAKLIQNQAIGALGGKDAADNFVMEAWKSNLQDFYNLTDPLLNAISSLFQIPIISGIPTEGVDAVENLSKFFAKRIKDYVFAQVISPVFKSDEVVTIAAEEFLRIYASQTDDLIKEMIDHARNYGGPDSAGALPLAFEGVSHASANISSGTAIAETQTMTLTELSELMADVNKDLGEAIQLTRLATATPAAPVAGPVSKILSAIRKVTKKFQQFLTIGAAIPAPLQLFKEIPKNLQQGVNAAFDIEPIPSSVSQLASADFPKRQSLMAVHSVSGTCRAVSQNLSNVFVDYRNQLQAVRALATADSIRKVREARVSLLKPADQRLDQALNRIGSLLNGAAANAFAKQTDGADSLFRAYGDSLFQFNAARWMLPYNFAHYSILGELEGGTSNPEYVPTKDNLLNLIDELDRRAGNLETVLQSSLDEYDARGDVKPTAIVDSVWVAIDDQPSQIVERIPTTVKMYARIRNLSAVNFPGLKMSLQKGSAAALSFNAGVDSTMMLPELAPADDLPGGADEFIGSWTLTYQGSLSNRHGLALTVDLASDSTNHFTGFSSSVYLSFRAADTDGDGMPDDYEAAVALSPSVDDAGEDADHDLLENLQEYFAGTDPKNSDSDADGISDGVEIAQGSNPLDANSPVSAGAAAVAFPVNIEVQSGGMGELPVNVSAGSRVAFAQLTVEYDSTLLRFDNVILGQDAAGFILQEINQHPNFSPSTPGANKNVLVRLAGGTNFFTGHAKQVAVFQFSAIASKDTITQMSFARLAGRTWLNDQDNLGLNIVSFTDATVSVRTSTVVRDDKADNALPLTFALYQNYPNPFLSGAKSPARGGGNPSTTIRFDVPRPSQVTIKVYDMLGREVKTLIDRKFEAGSHATVWDGKNNHQWPVASGVYFLRMHASEFVQVKKLVLVR